MGTTALNLAIIRIIVEITPESDLEELKKGLVSYSKGCGQKTNIRKTPWHPKAIHSEMKGTK